jgi:di/tricarboxylate transporter
MATAGFRRIQIRSEDAVRLIRWIGSPERAPIRITRVGFIAVRGPSLSPAVITLIVLALIVIGLFQDRIGPDFVMLGGLLILIFAGVAEPTESLRNFADPSVLTISALLVAGAGLRATGALETLSLWMLGRPKRNTSFLRLFGPVAALSAFMNNTPLVAFMLPIFSQLARKIGVSPSKLLIPLSYAAILGGTCTLIGTSTNLVLNSIITKAGLAPMGMFEITIYGLPVTIVGLLFLATVGWRLLPDNQDLLEQVGRNPREYIAEFVIDPGSPLAGKSIRGAGLRDLPGLYLYRIERGAEVLSPVSPGEVLQARDVLVFSGIVSNVIELQKIRGLHPLDHAEPSSGPDGAAAFASLDSLEGLPTQANSVPTAQRRRGPQLCEVVLSRSSPLVGMTVKDADFRARYNAAIIAVHRHSEKLDRKIGTVVLAEGDTLLIDADEGFSHRWRNSPDFVLVSGLEDTAPVMHEKAWFTLLVFAGVILAMSFGPMFLKLKALETLAALAGAAIIVFSRSVRQSEIYRSIDLSIVVMLGASLGISKALDSTGAGDILAGWLTSVSSFGGTWLTLLLFVLATGLLTELLSNNACAALMGALAIPLAARIGLDDPRPLMIAVGAVSSYGFATPIGYQTNLMVFNAGGYRTADFFRIGIPLDLVCWLLTWAILLARYSW